MSPPGFKARVAVLFRLGGGVCVRGSMRFASGVTIADLLAASMTAEPFSSMLPVSRHWWSSKHGSIVPQTKALLTDSF